MLTLVYRRRESMAWNFSTCSSPLFYSRAVHFSHLSGFSALSLSSSTDSAGLMKWKKIDETERQWDLRTYGRCYAQTRHPRKTLGRAWGVKSPCSSWARVSACFAYCRDTFLHSIFINRRLVWHGIPVLFHPIHIHRFEATTTLMWFRASRRGQYTGIVWSFDNSSRLSRRPAMDINYLYLAFCSSILNLRRSLSISITFLLTSLYNCIAFPSPYRDLPIIILGVWSTSLMWFISFYPLLFPLQHLCPRTHFPLSEALFLFPAHIVAHRLLRRPHDGGTASLTFTLGGRSGYLLRCHKDGALMIMKPILFYFATCFV